MVSQKEQSQMSPFVLPMPKRTVITLLCAFATFFSYLMRVVISMEILHMGDEFGWDERQRGVALSSFFYGYIVSQVISLSYTPFFFVLCCVASMRVS